MQQDRAPEIGLILSVLLLLVNLLRRCTTAIALAAAALALLTACTNDVKVSRADLDGYKWPFQADSVTLHCYESGAITVDADGKTWLVDVEFGDKSIPSDLPQVNDIQPDPLTGIVATPFRNLAQEKCAQS